MERDRMRREILAGRDQASPHSLAIKSELIIARLFHLAEVREAATIMFYASFRSEVQTMAAVTRAIKEGTRVALPLSLPKEKKLLPYLVKDPRRDLKPGFCAIPEPDPGSATLLNPAEIDLIIVPGSVFDRAGGRLGYGGGFYDRFLADQAPLAFRVGLAFELQVVADPLPLAAHDQPLDCLVTEAQTYRFVRATG